MQFEPGALDALAAYLARQAALTTQETTKKASSKPRKPRTRKKVSTATRSKTRVQKP
jgi:hypothetical protein